MTDRKHFKRISRNQMEICVAQLFRNSLLEFMFLLGDNPHSLFLIDGKHFRSLIPVSPIGFLEVLALVSMRKSLKTKIESELKKPTKKR